MEAAKALPKWITPDNDENRVWIHDGKLLLIPIDESRGGKPGRLCLSEALKFLQTDSEALVHSSFAEAEAFYRLEKYPAHITASLHFSKITIPRKLALILHEIPGSVAPAIEAFYLRGTPGMKALTSATSKAASKNLIFPPEDFVTVTTKFTRTLFAQLKSQYFEPVPAAWATVLGPSERAATSKSATADEKKTFARLEAGMKLTVGFELLSRSTQERDSKAVIEVRIMLEDFADDDQGTATASLPSNQDIKRWPHQERDDDEEWMEIDFADFEKDLGVGSVEKDHREGLRGKGNERSGFGDATAQASLRKMVERFEAFLNDESAGIEGAELGGEGEDDDEDNSDHEESDWADESEDEDKEVSFDENKFARLMKEMMGIPATEAATPAPATVPAARHQRQRRTESGGEMAVSKVGAAGKDSLISGANDNGEPEEIRKLMLQMEAELNDHGVLELDPTPRKLKVLKESGGSGDGAGAVQQAVQSSLLQTQPKPKPKPKGLSKLGVDVNLGASGNNDDGEEHNQEEDESPDDEQVDINYNLAKNLLESFKSQGGLAGPAGNILGLMGMQLPRDEDGDGVGGEEGNSRRLG